MVRSLLLLLLIAPGSIEGSHCMATDCSNIGTGLSLYLRVCCVNSNLGQGVTIKGNGIKQYFLCPKVPHKSCPSGRIICGLIIILQSFNADCKDWLQRGYNTNGVYNISDGKTTFFEVRQTLVDIPSHFH